VFPDGLLDALDPAVSILLTAGRHPVLLMVSLHHSSTTVSLASFDHIRYLGIDFKVKLLPILLLTLANLDVLEGDDSLRNVFRGVLEVIEAAIVEDEPTSLPGLPAPSLLQKPPFSFGRKESVHKIVISFIRNLERFFLDVPEDCFEHVRRQVAARVDAFILLYELLRRDLHLRVWIVEGGVEHDDGEGEDETGVMLLEDVWILTAVVAGEGIHHSVYLHRFSRKSKAPEELSQGLDQQQLRELVTVDEMGEDIFIKIEMAAEIGAYLFLGKPFLAKKKRSH